MDGLGLQQVFRVGLKELGSGWVAVSNFAFLHKYHGAVGILHQAAVARLRAHQAFGDTGHIRSVAHGSHAAWLACIVGFAATDFHLNFGAIRAQQIGWIWHVAPHVDMALCHHAVTLGKKLQNLHANDLHAAAPQNMLQGKVAVEHQAISIKRNAFGAGVDKALGTLPSAGRV